MPFNVAKIIQQGRNHLDYKAFVEQSPEIIKQQLQALEPYSFYTDAANWHDLYSNDAVKKALAQDKVLGERVFENVLRWELENFDSSRQGSILGANYFLYTLRCAFDNSDYSGYIAVNFSHLFDRLQLEQLSKLWVNFKASGNSVNLSPVFCKSLYRFKNDSGHKDLDFRYMVTMLTPDRTEAIFKGNKLTAECDQNAVLNTAVKVKSVALKLLEPNHLPLLRELDTSQVFAMICQSAPAAVKLLCAPPEIQGHFKAYRIDQYADYRADDLKAILSANQDDRGRSPLLVATLVIRGYAGDLDSLHCAAQYYQQGTIVLKDVEFALHLYARAAQQGHVPSQLKMAEHYYPDQTRIEKAMTYYEKAFDTDIKQVDISSLKKYIKYQMHMAIEEFEQGESTLREYIKLSTTALKKESITETIDAEAQLDCLAEFGKELETFSEKYQKTAGENVSTLLTAVLVRLDKVIDINFDEEEVAKVRSIRDNHYYLHAHALKLFFLVQYKDLIEFENDTERLTLIRNLYPLARKYAGCEEASGTPDLKQFIEAFARFSSPDPEMASLIKFLNFCEKYDSKTDTAKLASSSARFRLSPPQQPPQAETPMRTGHRRSLSAS